ncbi:origin recognition complex, subunit 4, partial [Aureobasidium melanogenum]
MESPRSAKRRKLETIPESPQRTTAAPPPTAAAANKTPRRDQHEVRDTIRVASVATPSSLNLTPSKPTPRPAPTSATKSNSKIGGLMARLNAKIAESQSPQKSPVKNGSNGTPATTQPELQELEKSAKVKTLSQKLRESFEQEQLERAAKRKPKRTLEDQMREIQDASRREVQGERATLSPVKAQPPPTTEKRKPGRPRKHPIVDVDTTEDDGPVSPSKLASARNPQHRAMSPMLLDINGTRQPQFTPRKAISSPLKPRPKAMIDLDVKPTQTNASANLSISSADLQSIQSAILDQLQERTHTPFVGLSSEYDKLASVVDQTIVAGESNSILLIGARGTGKSAVLNTILESQHQQNPDLFHVVRLNGFIHTDDKIALRDIWRQLGKEASAEDEFAAQNAADTLTTLLALLSHPEELGRSADQVTKSVIFVLDDDTTSLSLLTPPDSKLAALASLSTLQLALLIAACRLTIIHSTDVVTFALAHAEYVSLASKAKIAASASGQVAVGGGVARVWSKEVCKTAWEGLERRKLVMAEGKGGRYRVDVRLEEIGEAEVELGAVMGKWCREI